MLSADSRQQIQQRRQRPKVPSQPAGRGHEHSYRRCQLPQRQGRAMETRPTEVIEISACNNKCDMNA